VNRTFGKWMVLTLAMAIAGAAGAGCGDEGRGSHAVSEAGSVGFALSLPSGATVDTVNYTLTGPNGYSSMGSFSVSGPGTTFTHTLPGIPAGNGYQISLTATSSDMRPCKGQSATFNVVARQSVNVAVVLSCEGKGTSGSIVIDGKLNICPVVDSAIASPASAAVGATIALNGQGSDEDTGPGALTYVWTATGSVGTLSSATSAAATFACASAGTSTITLTVSDTDAQCTGNTLTVDVTCTGAGGGGAGAAGSLAGTGGAGESGAGAGGAGAGGAGAGGAGVGGAGAGGAGAGGAGAGGAGAGGAGAGGAGTGVGGAGAGGSSGGICEQCEMVNATCNQRFIDCGAITGTINGMPKSDICRQIVQCVRTTKCASDSATDSPSDCLCGLDVDVGVCSTQQLSALTGECKDIIATGAETTAVLDISTRLGDPTYAVGLAMRLIQCDQRFCATDCSF
jgi:hypothetical protein